jgi:chromosomal replication initiation ATPase DnaA
MSTIKTAVRVRPFLKAELQQQYRNTRLALHPERREVTLKDENSAHRKTFRCDYLLPQECDQEELFQQCGVEEMISKALEGYHSTIFAYGQTGSGKTYTMQGEESPLEAGQLNGIIPKVARKLF